MNNEITVTITGSSRPALLPYVWNSFKDMVHIRDDFNVIYHEDFVFPNESKKAIEYIKNNIPNVQIIESNPKIGFGRAINTIVNKTKTKYMLYFQDDWEFELPIDIDQLIWVMNRNEKIKHILFFKRNITKFLELHGKQLLPDEQIECNFDGVDMCLSHFKWTFLPSIWRMDYVRKYWKLYETKPEANFKKLLKGTSKELGCYMLGKHGSYRYVRHLGDDWMMEKMVNGKPGKRPKENYNTEGKAPWIKDEKRPQYEDTI